MSESDETPAEAYRPNSKVPGPHAYRYDGTGSQNNKENLTYGETEKYALKADFLEILSRGYTVDRAVRLLGHWATSENRHTGIDNVVYDESHPTFGRAVPSRKTFYVWGKEDNEFQEAWNESYSYGTEHLEDFALDLSYAGDSKMIQFLLKARNPAKYANFGQLSGSGFQITITPGDENL